MSHDAKKPTGTARRVRWDRGQIRLSECDLVVLPWVGEQYAVRFDQLQAHFRRQPLGPTKEAGQVTASTVRSCLERWRRAGVATSASLLAGEPGWVWLTRKGLRLAGLEYPLWEPGLSFLDHLFACNEARLWVEAHEPEAAWRSERVLRAEQAWSEVGVRQGHRPSAEVALEVDTVAVEVATTLKNPQRVREALPERLSRYPGCWYFVTPQTRAGIERILAELEPAVQAAVRLIDLPSVRGGEALEPPTRESSPLTDGADGES